MGGNILLFNTFKYMNNIKYTMVVSVLNNNISYPEIKNVDFEDLNVLSDTYQLLIKDVEVIVALGRVKNTYESESVLYFPIYLVNKLNNVEQIGVYEINANEINDLTDEDGNLDIENLDQSPLIYKFVTKKMLLKERLEPDTSIVEEGEEEQLVQEEQKEEIPQITVYEIPENRKDIFILTKGVPIPQELDEEDEKQASDFVEKYHASKTDNWVQKFMKNTNYDIIDNEGAGDCLFATIRDAFSSIAQQTTVNKLRKKLSEEIDEAVFANFKEQYDMYSVGFVAETNTIKELAAEYVIIQQKFANVIDRNEQKILTENATKIKEQHDTLVKEKKVTASLLNDYKFMKGIDTLDKLKVKVRSCDFWAELWSLGTLERILNIKFIILSSESYKNGDITSVLQCGMTDKLLDAARVFNPEFYLILDYTGSHYKLVSYKKKMIFKFKEIPYDIKKMIGDKCLEKNSGAFALIPDFNRFMQKSPKKASKKDDENFDDLNEAKLRGLYSNDIVLQFYSKSTGKPLPGKGAGETIPNEKIIDYKELAIIPDWRKKLSNFWIDRNAKTKEIHPFVLDNHKWASVEHYYQGAKFKKNNPEFYLSFSLDSGTELAKSPEMAKAAGGKTGKYKGTLIRPAQVSVDSDFFGTRHKKEMYDAQYAKFTQSYENNLKKLLLATGSAKLTHFSRGHPPITFEDLMIIRDKIRREDK
jgi:predicted NAD-dependent protein-ADP-ribosyltransferase YbiA (DUF1768 family)